MNTPHNFSAFEPAHLWALAIIACLAAVCALLARFKKETAMIKVLRYGLAFLLLANELVFFVYLQANDLWSYKWGLPLHLCDLAIYAVVYSLIRHNKVIWELAYFWGLGGTVQALLTPDLAVSFPDYGFIKFFLTHGSIVIGVVLLSAGLVRPISFGSVKRTFVITNLYAAFIGVFNWLFETNYLYLCDKPSQPSLMDIMGPWPYYIIGLEIALVASLLFYYLPYFLARRLKG